MAAARKTKVALEVLFARAAVGKTTTGASSLRKSTVGKTTTGASSLRKSTVGRDPVCGVNSGGK